MPEAETCCVDFAESRSGVCDGGGDDGDFFPEKTARSSTRVRDVCFPDCDLWNDDGGDCYCYCHCVYRRFHECDDGGVGDGCDGAMTDEVAVADPFEYLWVSLKTKLANRRIMEYVPYGQVRGSTITL